MEKKTYNMEKKTYNMEKKTLEGWVVEELDGKHIFANRPRKEWIAPQLSKSWVGYDIDYKKWLSQALDECKLNDLDHIRITIEVEKNMNKGINSNGFDYVDLGLPSGTLWATMNVGSSKPSDYGLYFAWGETYGYTADQIGKDKQFNSNDYKWSIYGSSSNFSKYKITGATLESEDDAAHVNMGGSWHMPTPTQIQELINETDNTWTTQDGVNGRLFTSKNNGKSIFIPAAGYASGGSLYDSGDYGYVWSSMLSTGNVFYGQDLHFDSDDAYFYSGSRDDGFSVRGVIG